MAINKESLEHRRLSDAIRLLQTSGDRVQLKIARNLKPKGKIIRECGRIFIFNAGRILIQDFQFVEFKMDYCLDSRQTSTLIESPIDDRCEYSSPDGVMSVDSAVHSWDSNNPDNTAGLYFLKLGNKEAYLVIFQISKMVKVL